MENGKLNIKNTIQPCIILPVLRYSSLQSNFLMDSPVLHVTILGQETTNNSFSATEICRWGGHWIYKRGI